MKIKNTFFLAWVLLGIFSFSACDDDSASDCDTKIYIPEEYLNWAPYFSTIENTNSNSSFALENETYYLKEQSLKFINESQDSQVWKLVYVVEKFNAGFDAECPLYQEVIYTFYCNELSQHLEYSYIYRLNGDGTSNPPNVNVPMLKLGVCDTKGEGNSGFLYGTCYPSAFNIDEYANNEKVVHLDTYSTSFSTYSDVFSVNLNNNPDDVLKYKIYIANDHGIVAYENQNSTWSLVE